MTHNSNNAMCRRQVATLVCRFLMPLAATFECCVSCGAEPCRDEELEHLLLLEVRIPSSLTSDAIELQFDAGDYKANCKGLPMCGGVPSCEGSWGETRLQYPSRPHRCCIEGKWVTHSMMFSLGGRAAPSGVLAVAAHDGDTNLTVAVVKDDFTSSPENGPPPCEPETTREVVVHVGDGT